MKPHVTVFMDGGEPFMAMHIGLEMRGLWRAEGIQCAGEVLKELVLADLATLTTIGPESQKAWDGIKTIGQWWNLHDQPSAP